jgi:hypothetical protein
MLTLNTVNKALKKLGANEQLAKGKDYYYFYDGNTPSWSSTAVYVTRLNDLPLERWIEEWQSMNQDYLQQF